jgi:hypothetical protein
MKSKTKKAKRGPKADLLKIDGNWQDAMKTMLYKKKSDAGWHKLKDKK